MLEAAPLLAVTCLFIGAFTYFIASIEIDDIRNHWADRRCEFTSILFAQKIPQDPSIDKDKFSEDNFYFCLEKTIDSVLKRTLAPLLGLFKKQLDVVQPIQESINNLKSSGTSYLNPLNSVFNSANKKLTTLAYESSRISTRLKMAMQRMNAAFVSILFAGISMYQGIQNSIQYVIKVCLIILGILVALVFFLWFVMFPFIPTILAVISAISIVLGSAAVGGMASAFCVSPDTLVAVSEDWIPVSQLKPGDILRGGSMVEGILHTTGKGAKCVSIDGIVMSACHLLYHNKRWIPAEEHPLAKQYITSVDELYCLNTSDRKWIVKGYTSEYTLRDWEELPSTPTMDVKWESYIATYLNTTLPTPFDSNPGRGLLRPDTPVYLHQKGPVPISSIRIGDKIKDNDSYTKVIGTYRDISGPTKALWQWNGQHWIHPSLAQSLSSTSVHLVTESGTFMTSTYGLIRDFTEIGWHSIDDSYSLTSSYLEENS